MTHAIRARKERGAKIVAVDICQTETMRQADLTQTRRGTTSVRSSSRPPPPAIFLNSTFTQTPTSLMRERRPEVLIKPADAELLDLKDGHIVRLGNERGQTRLHIRLFEGVRQGVLVSEGVWPPSAFLDGWGVNALVGDDSVAPHGGVAFHDVRVWASRA